MRDGRLLILGAGALAREIVLALPAARLEKHRLDVVIASRDRERAEWLACLGAARAALTGAAASFAGVAISWDEPDQLAELLHVQRPRLILHTASLQSAWTLAAGNEWSDMVAGAGYGVTVALQMALLSALGRALKASGVDAQVVNACYPDVVNACGRHLGVDIVCGLGNVALLADWFAMHASGKTLRVLAGHWDVQQLQQQPGLRRGVPRAWAGEEEVPAELLLAMPALPRDPSLNAFNASTSARLLCAMVFGRDERDLHVPGPHGLPGGYPITLDRGVPALHLPDGVSRDDAIAWNAARNLMDGAAIEGERVRFSPRAAERLRAVAPELSDGFRVGESEAVAAAFRGLRERLSLRPACGSQG